MSLSKAPTKYEKWLRGQPTFTCSALFLIKLKIACVVYPFLECIHVHFLLCFVATGMNTTSGQVQYLIFWIFNFFHQFIFPEGFFMLSSLSHLSLPSLASVRLTGPTFRPRGTLTKQRTRQILSPADLFVFLLTLSLSSLVILCSPLGKSEDTPF